MTEQANTVPQKDLELYTDIKNSDVIGPYANKEIERFIRILNTTHHVALIGPFLRAIAAVIADAHRYEVKGVLETKKALNSEDVDISDIT
jgi:hypothetical protein